MVAAKKAGRRRVTEKPRWILDVGLLTDNQIAVAIDRITKEISDFEAKRVDYEDWEDGDVEHPPPLMLRARLGMLTNERDRRIGERKWTLAINEKIRIDMEGPGLGARVL
jgi:hypothetical protein